MRILPILMLLTPMALNAEPPAAAGQDSAGQGALSFPRPMLLDWGGQFRLNAAPTNVSNAGLKRAEAADEEQRRRLAPNTPSSNTNAPLGPDDSAKARPTNRAVTSDDNRLVAAPVKSGPVSLGASYGQYRAVPALPTREVEAHDMRVSVGVAF